LSFSRKTVVENVGICDTINMQLSDTRETMTSSNRDTSGLNKGTKLHHFELDNPSTKAETTEMLRLIALGVPFNRREKWSENARLKALEILAD